MLSQYEQDRADRIAQNQLRLKQLGLDEVRCLSDSIACQQAFPRFLDVSLEGLSEPQTQGSFPKVCLAAQTVEQFSRITRQPVRPRAAPRPKRPLTAEDLAAQPRRRSERSAGKAAVNYDESILDRVDGTRTRAKREGTGKALALVQGENTPRTLA